MDKDEHELNIQEAEEAHARDLELRHKREVDSNNAIIKARKLSIDHLSACVDMIKNYDFFVQYFIEQSNLYPENHYECIDRANKTLEDKKDERKKHNDA